MKPNSGEPQPLRRISPSEGGNDSNPLLAPSARRAALVHGKSRKTPMAGRPEPSVADPPHPCTAREGARRGGVALAVKQLLATTLKWTSLFLAPDRQRYIQIHEAVVVDPPHLRLRAWIWIYPYHRLWYIPIHARRRGARYCPQRPRAVSVPVFAVWQK